MLYSIFIFITEEHSLRNKIGTDKKIKVITKLPNSEQSYKGKVKTHKRGKMQEQDRLAGSEYRNL
jgi:hypothetical protein